MPEFNVRADAVNVEQIMDQIRARIREKRGVDYTEDQVRELASVKLEKFLDPRGVRSDLLDQFKRAQVAQAPPAPPNYRFEEDTLFETHRGPVRVLRRLLQPLPIGISGRDRFVLEHRVGDPRKGKCLTQPHQREFVVVGAARVREVDRPSNHRARGQRAEVRGARSQQPLQDEANQFLECAACSADERSREAGVAQVSDTPVATLADARTIGRSKLPTTVLGCLVHAAEHAYRHAGQVITTARMW